jgi:hypothetical protein
VHRPKLAHGLFVGLGWRMFDEGAQIRVGLDAGLAHENRRSLKRCLL